MSTFGNLTCNINETIHKERVNDIVYGQKEIIVFL